MRFFSCSFHDSSAALSPKNAGRLTTKAGPRAWLGHLATSNNSDAVRQSFPYLMPKATTNDLHDDTRFHGFPNCSLDTTERKLKRK